VWADAALFGEWGGGVGRNPAGTSFAGVEVVTDWASATPVIVSPELGIGLKAGDVPLRILVGVPFFVANRDRGPWVGGLLRLMLELDRN
jgi:hypothetical protein